MKTTKPPLVLRPGSVSLSELRKIYEGSVELKVADDAWAGVSASHQTIQKICQGDDTVYGVNTGFGKLAGTKIEKSQIETLQENLVLSHSVGVGSALSDGVTRLVMATKIVSLARGFSGVRREVIDALVALYNAGAVPQIPAKGSVGASGDLAPLAHLSCVLIGHGQVKLSSSTTVVSGAEALKSLGIAVLRLGPKEGLALLNGTQVSTSLALSGLFEAEKVFAAGVLAGALSLEAIKGSVKPFDARIHEARGQKGQIAVAGAVRSLLEGSEILTSHIHCARVQDPYSIRCVPQVMGACMDNLTHAAGILAIEANAASDNPLVFAETGEAVSGGNFHAEPVAFAADIIALALAEVGAISERRLSLLLDSNMSELPPFLVAQSGVNSGFMIAQVTAAALASENKSLAHPASVDSIPTSANQEDHVSMATFAARRLADMAENTATVVAIEAMAAAQGMEFRRPLRSSAVMEKVFDDIREHVDFLESDRFMATDIAAMVHWVSKADRHEVAGKLLPSRR